jgi:hypothetical protein
MWAMIDETPTQACLFGSVRVAPGGWVWVDTGDDVGPSARGTAAG